MEVSYTDPAEQPNSVPKNVAVSVSVLTYNHAGYIRQALDGVLMQRTSFPFEILVGEDCSKDGTREICLEYARRSPEKIRLFLRSEEGKIFMNGRQTGRLNSKLTQAAARGKYLALLEGDDFWIHPHKLQMQHDFMEANPSCAMSGTRCAYWNAVGNSEVEIRPAWQHGNFVSYKKILEGGLQIHTSTFFFRTSDLRSVPSWTGEVVQRDTALTLVFAQRSGGIPVLSALTSIRRITGRGLWTSIGSARKATDVQDLWLRFAEYACQIGDETGERIARRRIRNLEIRQRLREARSPMHRLYYRGIMLCRRMGASWFSLMQKLGISGESKS